MQNSLFSIEEVGHFSFNEKLIYILEDIEHQLKPGYHKKEYIRSEPICGKKYSSVNIICTVLNTPPFEKSYFKKVFSVSIENEIVSIKHSFGAYTFATNQILTILHRFKKIKIR